MIFVTVGSRPYPFDRLFKKLDELCENGTISDAIFAQIGTSSYEPRHFAFADFISPEEFQQKILDADIVISHGASGSIMKALNAGKKVVAVARLEKYGEHINDHQIQMIQAFESNGYVLSAAEDLHDLGDCIQKIKDGKEVLTPWENRDPLAIVNLIDDFIQREWQQ